MDIKKIIPGPEPLLREALIVLGGIVIARLVLNYIPGVKAWAEKNGVL